MAHSGFGYLLKDRVLEVSEFLAAAERVASGGSALDPKVVARLVSADRDTPPLSRLSDREREVLTLMAEGLTNSAVAQRLVVSDRTVEAHIRHVLTKLDIPEHHDAHRRVLAVPTSERPLNRCESLSTLEVLDSPVRGDSRIVSERRNRG